MIAPTPPRALEQIIAIGIFLAGTFAGDYLLGPIPAMWLIVLAALVFLRQRPSQREPTEGHHPGAGGHLGIN